MSLIPDVDASGPNLLMTVSTLFVFMQVSTCILPRVSWRYMDCGSDTANSSMAAGKESRGNVCGSHV